MLNPFPTIYSVIKKLFLLLSVMGVLAVSVLVIMNIYSFASFPNHKPSPESFFFSEEGYKDPDCNVILISIDTLRADHLGCYDYHRKTSPNIDRFAKDSVLCKENVVQAPSTEPSHASIFTSVIPSHHGAFFAKKQNISENVPTIAELLKKEGYQTISFNAGGQVSSEFGFARGFDHYDDKAGGKFINPVKRAIKWINKHSETKFFVFLHTYEVHADYLPEKKYLRLFEDQYGGKLPDGITTDLIKEINNGEIEIDAEDRQHIINTYDAGIYSMDVSFGVLIDYLKQKKIYDNSLIIFTSDHGEELGEHGMIGWHSHALYDEQLLVPLIIKFPCSKFSSKVIEEQTRSIDIVPTIFDILDLKPLKHFEGISLISWFDSKHYKNHELFAISEQDTPSDKVPTSIRIKKWKLYDNGDKGLLFNLENDPGEGKDLFYNFFIEYYLDSKSIELKTNNTISILKNQANETIALDEEKINELKSLGYVQ